MGWNGASPVEIDDIPKQIHNLFVCSTLTLEDVFFQGFAIADTTNSALIRAYNLQTRNVSFNSISNSTGKPTVHMPDGWGKANFEDTTWCDFCTWENESPSIGQGTGLALQIDRPDSSVEVSVYGSQVVYGRNLVIDEGSGGINIGKSGKTTLSANFVQPQRVYNSPYDYVTITVADNSWIRPGDLIEIAGGGFYYVDVVNGNGHGLTVRNFNGELYLAAALPGATVTGNGTQIVRGNTIQGVDLKHVRMNVNPSSNKIGIDLKNIRSAGIEYLWTREGGNNSKAVKGRDIGSLTLKNTITRYDDSGGLSAIDCDNSVDVLNLIDSHFDRSGSTAKKTVETKNGVTNVY